MYLFIYCSTFTHVVSGSAWEGMMIMNNRYNIVWWEGQWYNLKYFPNTCLEGPGQQ